MTKNSVSVLHTEVPVHLYHSNLLPHVQRDHHGLVDARSVTITPHHHNFMPDQEWCFHTTLI